MNRNDINRIYTEQVAQLLSQGYEIHPFSMSGTQGEIAHIDLCNGSEIIRVLIDVTPSYGESYGDILSIKIGRYTNPLRRTLWNDSLEIISEIKLAKIGSTFYATLAEGKQMLLKRQQRALGKMPSMHVQELGDAYKSIALRWICRQPRMKKCRLEDITQIVKLTWKNSMCYEITAKGKKYTLCIRK